MVFPPITKDDVGKLFRRRNGAEAVCLSVSHENIYPVTMQDCDKNFKSSHQTDGKWLRLIEEDGLDVVARIVDNRTPKTPAQAVTVIPQTSGWLVEYNGETHAVSNPDNLVDHLRGLLCGP